MFGAPAASALPAAASVRHAAISTAVSLEPVRITGLTCQILVSVDFICFRTLWISLIADRLAASGT